MNRDLRTTFHRLAPSPAQELDIASLMNEGRRRRRVQMVTLAAVASVVVIAAAVLVPQLDPPRDRSKPAPADTVTPQPGPTGVRNPLDELPQGWTELPEPPEARSSNAAIGWTGDTLIVWSGYVYTGFGDESPEPDGFAFDAEAREWYGIADPPLAPRVNAASAWTGREFLVWGGSDDRYTYFDDGAAYDPARDTWRTLPDAPIDARAPLSVWTGTELIVWGTLREIQARSGGGQDLLRDGAAYNPSTNSWRRIADGPIELARGDAVWTGREMIVFGGDLDPENESDSTPYSMGAAYDPASDSWRRLPEPSLTDNSSTAAWTGSEMIAWDYLLASAAYDPTIDEWRSIPGVPLEDYECAPESVAIGDDIFGNYCGAQVLYSSSTQRWSRVKPPTSDQVGWGYALVAADPVVLLIGRNVETEQEAFLAYRPEATSTTSPTAGDQDTLPARQGPRLECPRDDLVASYEDLVGDDTPGGAQTPEAALDRWFRTGKRFRATISANAWERVEEHSSSGGAPPLTWLAATSDGQIRGIAAAVVDGDSWIVTSVSMCQTYIDEQAAP